MDLAELMREEEDKALATTKAEIEKELADWHALPQEEKDRLQAIADAKAEQWEAAMLAAEADEDDEDDEEE